MRKLTPIGTVVVAVSHSEGKKLYVFGRGVFEGCFLPPAINLPESLEKFQREYVKQASVTPDLPPTFTEEEARKAIILSQANPRIRLTETMDGQPLDVEGTDNTVWGYECWWGTEEDFSEDSGKFEIVNITVAQHRADVAQMEKEAAEEEAQLHAALCSMGGVAHDHSHEN